MVTPKPIPRRRFLLIFGIVILIAIIGIGIRMHSSWGLKNETQENAITTVSVIKAGQGESSEEIVLPGNVVAWHEAMLYARTNGYVKNWYYGMGSHVKEGELLADIETPELDAQLRQADADVKTAEANEALAQSTAERWKALLKTDSVSKQDADVRIADAKAAEARLAAAAANRDHLKELASFKHVVAPFDGTISARLLDVGMLVNDGTFGQMQTLFKMVQADRLRIYVQVPENYAGAITPGMKGELSFAEHPGKFYDVDLYKTADAIDSTSRTLLIEFVYDNTNGELLAGGYTDVHLKIATSADNVRLPVNTLIFRAQGLQVATVDENGHAVLKPITMGRDFGNEVEVLSGVTPGETIIINPPDSLINGEAVRIAKSQADNNQEGQSADKKSDKKDAEASKEEKKS